MPWVTNVTPDCRNANTRLSSSESEELIMTVDQNFGLDPNALYRKYSPEAQRAIGLKETAMNDAIARGDIDPPVPVTENGRAVGWYGYQLIALCRKRLELAAQRRAAPKQPTRAASKRRG